MSQFLARLHLLWPLLLLGCAQPSSSTTAPAPSPDTTPTTAIGMPAAAARHGRADLPADKDDAMPGASGPEPIRGTAIPAATLRKQILDLVGGLRSLQDLERPGVETSLQVKLVEDRGLRDGYRYDGRTTEGWNYGVSVSRVYGAASPPSIVIGLDDGVEPWTDQKPTYCTLDFESLAKDLVALGYERDQKRSILGDKPSWGFGKDVSEEKAGFGILVYLYYVDGDYPVGRACVRGVDIGGATLRE